MPVTRRCWGCDTVIQDVPSFDGIAVPIIECPQCGSLVEDLQNAPRYSDWAVNRPHKPIRRLSQTLLGIFTSTFVVILIVSISAATIAIFLPQLPLPLSLSYSIQSTTSLLVLYIIYNFISTSHRHPGPVSIHNNNSLHNYTWCSSCRYPKPPSAHHCRRCNICVVNLDHHCIFTGNRCIGENNIDAFDRFLTSLFACSTLCSVILSAVGWKRQAILLHHMIKTWQSKLVLFGSIGRVSTFALRWIVYAPSMEIAVWSICWFLSVSVCIWSGLLVRRQNVLKRKGTTWLEELKKDRASLSIRKDE